MDFKNWLPFVLSIILGCTLAALFVSLIVQWNLRGAKKSLESELDLERRFREMFADLHTIWYFFENLQRDFRTACARQESARNQARYAYPSEKDYEVKQKILRNADAEVAGLKTKRREIIDLLTKLGMKEKIPDWVRRENPTT